jgi:hypothetical protein
LRPDLSVGLPFSVEYFSVAIEQGQCHDEQIEFAAKSPA